MAVGSKIAPWYRDPLSWLCLLLLGPVIAYSLLQLIGFDRLASMTKSDWASWVQAIGSIIAILVAAGVVLVQHSLETARLRNAEVETIRKQLTSALTLIERALDFCVRAKVWLPIAADDRIRSAARAMTGELQALQSGCARLDITMAPGGYVAKDMLVLAGAISGFVGNVENIEANAYKEHNGRAQFVRYVEDQVKRLTRAQERFGKALGKLPPAPDQNNSLEVEFRMELRSTHDWY